jgi:hypothetical protein
MFTKDTPLRCYIFRKEIPLSSKIEYLNAARIFFYLITTYLIFQFHEMGHWLTAIYFGQKFVVMPAGVVRTNFEEASQLANVSIAGMGVVFNLIISTFGILLLLKAKDRFWNRTGYFFGFVSNIGMVAYHIAGLFGLMDNDSGSVARCLNIPQPLVIIPVTVIFVLLSVIIIRNVPKEYKGSYYSLIFFCMILLERFLVVYLYEAYMHRQYNNGGFVIEIVDGFPLSLILISLISIGLFILFVANRNRYFQYRAS